MTGGGEFGAGKHNGVQVDRGAGSSVLKNAICREMVPARSPIPAVHVVGHEGIVRQVMVLVVPFRSA